MTDHLDLAESILGSASNDGGPGLSSRCYSAHVPNVSESPTGSPVDPTPVAARAGGFRDKLAGAAIPIMQRVKTVMLGEDLMPLARDIVDRMLPLSVSMADALTGELDELRLYVGVIDRRRDELAAERDELRARLDAVLAAASDAARDIGNDTGSDVECYGDDYWRGMVMAASRILGDVRRAAEGVE